MKPDHGDISGLLPARTPARSIVPVLIQVPALSAAPRRPGRPSPARRRRRLRKEVRAVGSALLIGLTATAGLLPLWGGPAPARTQSAPALASASPSEDGPVVSLSPAIEPAATTTATASATPRDCGHLVVLPGFIVPDDGAEEPCHARN